MEGTQGCPPISALVRLTRWSSPAKPARLRLASTLPPIERGSSEAPTMATERGFRRRATAADRRHGAYPPRFMALRPGR